MAVVKKDDRQTNVRLPADLKDRITQAAEQASRSFTAELVARLEESFDSFLQRRVKELEKRLADAEELRSIADETAVQTVKMFQQLMKEQGKLVSELAAVRAELQARDERSEFIARELQASLDRLDGKKAK